MKNFAIPWMTLCAATLVCCAAAAERNLLVNPGFKDGLTNGWTDRTTKRQKVSAGKADGLPEGVNALRVDIVADGGKSHGQIIQFVPVRPGVAYRVKALVNAGLPDIAYMQIKQMKGKSEGERLSTDTNKKAGAWEVVERELTTSPDTTALQVLFRFRMNAGCVGKSVFLAQPSLVALDDGDEPPAPFEPPKPVEPKVAKAGVDMYVTPTGAGRRDGRDWDHALAAADGGLQKAWDAAGPGDTVFVAGGEYGVVSLQMAEGGASAEKPKRLVGVDRGVPGFKRPVFTGTWRKEKPASGPTFISMSPGACFIEIANIELRGYKGALVAKGPNHGLRILDVDARECRDAFWIDGGAAPSVPDSGSRGIVMDGCDVILYTKRALRTMNGVHHMKVLNCVADAGGRDYAIEIFPVGFHILGGKLPAQKDHHIEFVNCEARNNWHVAGPDKYWNADGYAAERNTADLTFVNCRAFGNTDGGWDIKSTRPKWVDCVGIANKRNFRVWTQPAGEKAIFENCLSAYSIDYGDRGHDVGFWIQAGGEATLDRCTAWEDRVPVSVESRTDDQASTLNLGRCIISPSAKGHGMRRDGVVTVNDRGSVVRDRPDAPVVRLKAPSRKMKDPGDAFDSVSHPEIGYKSRTGNQEMMP